MLIICRFWGVKKGNLNFIDLFLDPPPEVLNLIFVHPLQGVHSDYNPTHMCDLINSNVLNTVFSCYSF